MFRRLQPVQAAVDVGIAFVFFLIAYPLTGADSTGLLALGLGLALGFRRFSPAIALIVAWGAALFQMYVLHLNPVAADLAILAVIYATAAYGTKPVRWIGFASVFVGAIVGGIFVVYGGRDFIVSLNLSFSSFAYIAQQFIKLALYGLLFLVILGLPWTAGNLVRARSVAQSSRQAQAQAEVEAKEAERDVIIEQERNRIARDMHDVVAHSLAVVIAQADGARYAQMHDPKASEEALLTISSTAREALADVRLLLGQLRHSQTAGPQPALSDLGRLLEQLRASGLTIASKPVEPRFRSETDISSRSTASCRRHSPMCCATGTPNARPAFVSTGRTTTWRSPSPAHCSLHPAPANCGWDTASRECESERRSSAVSSPPRSGSGNSSCAPRFPPARSPQRLPW